MDKHLSMATSDVPATEGLVLIITDLKSMHKNALAKGLGHAANLYRGQILGMRTLALYVMHDGAAFDALNAAYDEMWKAQLEAAEEGRV